MHAPPDDARSHGSSGPSAEGRRAQSLTLMARRSRPIASWPSRRSPIGRAAADPARRRSATGVASICLRSGIPSRDNITGGARHDRRRRSRSLVAFTPRPPPLAACRYADEPAAHVAYDDWQRTIVDTTSRLPKGYVPPDLVTVSRAGLSGRGSIRRIAIADLKALAVAARKARVRLAVESAYRSEARQQRTFAGWVRTSGDAEAETFQCARGTLGAPARDRHRFQGGGRRVPLDASIRALAACAMAGGQRLAVRLDPELSAGCGDTDLLRP